jgi:beta-phosphoglucomutase family hydrolase
MKINAVIFDMDGVLVDNAEYHRKAWLEFSRLKGHPITLDEFESIGFGDVNRRYLEFVFKRPITDDELESLANEKELVYRELIEKKIQPVKGLTGFLEQVKQEKLKTGVGTSAPRVNLDFVLDTLGIRQYFDVLVDDSYVSHGKPNPEIYLKVAEMLQVDPQQCIVIEDAYHGIEAAHRAGMRCVGLPTTYPPERIAAADLIVNDFTELNLKDLNDV